MAEQIRVAWCSPMNLPKTEDLFPDFKVFRINTLVDIERNCDLLVLDIRNFKSLENLQGRYGDIAVGLPKILFVDTLEQESVALACLATNDEICRREAITQQISLLLERIACRIKLKQINEDNETHNFNHPVTASFGVASTSSYFSYEELIKAADKCLYAAKNKGRNCVVTAPEFHERANADEQEALLADFENRIRVNVARMTNWMVLKAIAIIKYYQEQANHDCFLEIFNRHYLDRLLLRELEKSRQNNRPLTILLLDLDHFGAVNKTYGFPTGDIALKAAAEILRHNVRAGDWVARYGGEEFCIVMPDSDLSGGCLLAERIRLAMEQKTLTAYNGQNFRVTASIGVVQLMSEDGDIVSLFQRASDKVAEAKMGGRNQVRS